MTNWFDEANHIAYGDASALANLTGPFHRSQKTFRFLMADSVNFSDLRGQPLVLIGLGGNPWTKRFIAGLRYTVRLDPETNDYEIHDDQARSSSPWHFSFSRPLNSTTRDYGVITRFSNPSIEQPTMIVAGIGPYATTGAAEFVTNAQILRRVRACCSEGLG